VLAQHRVRRVNDVGPAQCHCSPWMVLLTVCCTGVACLSGKNAHATV
jgi:hypothetical protein